MGLELGWSRSLVPIFMSNARKLDESGTGYALYLREEGGRGGEAGGKAEREEGRGNMKEHTFTKLIYMLFPNGHPATNYGHKYKHSPPSKQL